MQMLTLAWCEYDQAPPARGEGDFMSQQWLRSDPCVPPGLLFINLWEILTEYKCWHQSKETSWYDILSPTIKTFICPQAAVFAPWPLFVMTAANDRNKTTVATKTL